MENSSCCTNIYQKDPEYNYILEITNQFHLPAFTTSRTGTEYRSLPCFSGVRFAQSLVFSVVFCKSSLVCLSLFWPLYCLSFFELRLMITPWESSYFCLRLMITPLVSSFFCVRLMITPLVSSYFCLRLMITPLVSSYFCVRLMITPLVSSYFCLRLMNTPLYLHTFVYDL